MRYDPCLEICALAFLLIVAISFFSKGNLYTRSGKLYGLFLCIMLTNLVFDIASAYTTTYSTHVPLWLNMFVNTGLFLLQIGLPGMFMVYIMGLTGCLGNTRKDVVLCWVLLVPCLCAVGMVFANLFVGGLFYLDEHMQYFRGTEFCSMYVIAAFYIVCGMYFLWRYRKRVRPVQFYLITLYVGLMIVAMMVQYFFPHYLLTGAVVALALSNMYLTFQSPDDYIDRLTGLYERDALFVVMDYQKRERRDYSLIFIDIKEFKTINTLFGFRGGDQLLCELAQNLLRICKNKRRVFRMGSDQFAVIGEKKKIGQLLLAVEACFRAGFTVLESKLQVSYCVCIVQLHQVQGSRERLMAVFEHAIGVAKWKTGHQVVVDNAILDYVNRRFQIETTLRQIDENHCLSLYFQPIYSLAEQKFTAAEVLLRMKDEKLGMVYPSEFIEVAEQKGLICKLGQFVLESTCRFLRENALWELGIKTIEINLSLAELLQGDPAGRILSIIRSFPHFPTKLNFEITETTAARSKQRVLDMMQELSQEGITFSLDDYGQGYSNGNSVVQFPFQNVKMDRELLWEAFCVPKARTFYCNTVKMLQEMQMKIVSEGVETEEQIRFLKELGVDYIQGFYYSRPLPGDRFVSFLEEHAAAGEKKEQPAAKRERPKTLAHRADSEGMREI
ncbi:MAG: EAL domain-containing protein [Oscillospiraceae bacterium]